MVLLEQVFALSHKQVFALSKTRLSQPHSTRVASTSVEPPCIIVSVAESDPFVKGFLNTFVKC